MIEPDDIKKSLKSDEYKLYKLIFNRFISSRMADAVYKTVSADAVNSGAEFQDHPSAD